MNSPATLSSTVKTADWKAEKHVPAIAAPASAKADEPFDVEIDVGKEIPHPNTAQHHICWIALHFVPEGSNTSIELGRADFSAHGASLSDAPGPAATASSARFRVRLAVPGVLHATAYCNLHGLWTSSAPIAVA
jgi:superoxide reductase